MKEFNRIKCNKVINCVEISQWNRPHRVSTQIFFALLRILLLFFSSGIRGFALLKIEMKTTLTVIAIIVITILPEFLFSFAFAHLRIPTARGECVDYDFVHWSDERQQSVICQPKSLNIFMLLKRRWQTCRYTIVSDVYSSYDDGIFGSSFDSISRASTKKVSIILLSAWISQLMLCNLPNENSPDGRKQHKKKIQLNPPRIVSLCFCVYVSINFRRNFAYQKCYLSV